YLTVTHINYYPPTEQNRPSSQNSPHLTCENNSPTNQWVSHLKPQLTPTDQPKHTLPHCGNPVTKPRLRNRNGNSPTLTCTYMSVQKLVDLLACTDATAVYLRHCLPTVVRSTPTRFPACLCRC